MSRFEVHIFNSVAAANNGTPDHVLAVSGSAEDLDRAGRELCAYFHGRGGGPHIHGTDDAGMFTDFRTEIFRAISSTLGNAIDLSLNDPTLIIRGVEVR